MLSMETKDSWAGEITITSPATSGNTATYTHSGHPSGYDFARSFVAWANDAARPWASVFSWSWGKHTDSGAKLIVTCSSTFDLSSDLTAYRRVGITTHNGVTTATGINSMQGTWAPGRYGRLQVARLFQYSNEVGDANAAGAIRPFAPGLAGSAPSVSAWGSPIDSARFAEQMALASNPRKATVYQLHTDKWVAIAVGAVRRESLDFVNYRFTIEARGI
mgnify:CR=1 FL=1|tara:strand:- start:63 stop:719 length:657 start_codon:yes stop_codon:yes gene_type:complete